MDICGRKPEYQNARFCSNKTLPQNVFPLFPFRLKSLILLMISFHTAADYVSREEGAGAKGTMTQDASMLLPCEVVILTALPVECRAVLRYLQETEEVIHPSGTIYHRGTFAG